MIIFIVLGRLSTGLSVSKILPIINSEAISQAYVFSNKRHIEHHKINYILLTKILSESNFVFKRLIRILYEPLQLIYYSIKYKPDIINGVFTIPKGYNSYLASRIIKCKNIISILGNVNEIEAWIKYTSVVKKFHLWLYRHTDVVTTKGKKISDYLIKHNIPQEKIFVFNGAIDTNKYKPNNTTKEIDILFVGYFSQSKGPDRVLEVINKLKYHFKDIKSVFLGNGPLFDEIKSKIKQYNLENNVKLVGYSYKTEEYYRKSKLLLMPSKSEGLSTSMLEAMSSGCVPIVSDVGSMTDAAKHNFNALVVKNYLNIKEFIEQSKTLLQDELKRAELADNAVKYVNTYYSIKAQTQVFDKIISYLKFNK